MRGRNEYRIHATSRIAGPSLDAGGATPYDGAREDSISLRASRASAVLRLPRNEETNSCFDRITA
jgi:hypothetical protein